MSFQATGGFKTELLFEICQLLEISVDRSLGIYTTILWLIIFSIKCAKILLWSMTSWSVLVIVLNRCTLAFLTVWYCFQHHSKHWIQICFKCQETEKFISEALSRATGGFQTRYLLTVLNPSVSWDFSKLQTAVWVYTCSCTTNKNPIRFIWTLKRNAFRQKGLLAN